MTCGPSVDTLQERERVGEREERKESEEVEEEEEKKNLRWWMEMDCVLAVCLLASIGDR